MKKMCHQSGKKQQLLNSWFLWFSSAWVIDKNYTNYTTMDNAGNIIPISQSTKLYFGPTYVCPGPSSDSLTHWFFKAFGLQTRQIQDLTYIYILLTS